MTHTQTQQKETYNGWANYATWRIALEWFDNFNPDEQEKDAYELSKTLQSYVEEGLEIGQECSFVVSYALAFIDDVNWYEIASHLIEDNQ